MKIPVCLSGAPALSAPVRCSECGEPATYTGVRLDASNGAIDGLRGLHPPPVVPHRTPFCAACAQRLDARGAFVPTSVHRS
jgi:hypothetical protein